MSSKESETSSESKLEEEIKKDKKKKIEKKKQKQSRSRSASSERQSGDSASKSKEKKKKHKHEHKHKKHHKKHKHIKKSKLQKEQERYGKYGYITMADLNKKKDEFRHWLREIKGMNIEAMSHVEEKKLFETFVEDYNTASFTSKKYYDIQKWELKLLMKNKKSDVDEQIKFDGDEKILKQQQNIIKDQKKNEKILEEYYRIVNFNQNKIQEMNSTMDLQRQMKNFYQTGNLEEAAKIKALFEKKGNNTINLN